MEIYILTNFLNENAIRFYLFFEIVILFSYNLKIINQVYHTLVQSYNFPIYLLISQLYLNLLKIIGSQNRGLKISKC